MYYVILTGVESLDVGFRTRKFTNQSIRMCKIRVMKMCKNVLPGSVPSQTAKYVQLLAFGLIIFRQKHKQPINNKNGCKIMLIDS